MKAAVLLLGISETGDGSARNVQSSLTLFLSPIPAMLIADVQKKIEEIEKRANKEIDTLARQYFDQILVPFCNRYNLWFDSSMGSIAFFSEKHCLSFYYADEIPDAEECGYFDEDELHPSEKFALEFPGAKKEMEEIFAVINIIAFGFEFGFSMPCYRPE